MKKKILYITTVSDTINAFLIPHITMLIDSGYQVDCACCVNKQINHILVENGVHVYDIPFTRRPLSIKNISAFKQLKKIQETHKYDIVHVHTPVASVYGRLLKMKHFYIKTIYTAHGYHFYKGAPMLNWLIYYPIEKIMAKITDVTININKEDFEITKNKLKPKKAYFVNGVGIDLTKYNPLSAEEKIDKKQELGLDSDDFIIIMIAEFNKNKNQKQLIEAISLLKDKYPNIKAVCVGEGVWFEKIKQEIDKKSLQYNVKLLGYRTDVNELINISDVGVLLSYREGLPRNIMELMACGKPVIGTNIRGIKDLVSEENGKIVECDDYKMTAKKIEELYLERNRIIQYSEIALRKVEKFSIENINEDIKRIYLE